MAALPYMQLYVADYLADTAHLTTEEHGAYMLLIMNYWQTGHPLPNDDLKLSRICRLTKERWTDVKRTLIEFFTIDERTWNHKRIDADLEKVNSKKKQASAAGKASAKARKTKQANVNKQEIAINGRSTDVEQTFNHTDTDTDTENNNNAREEWIELGKELADQCNMPRADFLPVKHWLDAGVSSDTIRKAVREASDRARCAGRVVNTFKFFEREVMAAQHRKAPAKPSNDVQSIIEKRRMERGEL